MAVFAHNEGRFILECLESLQNNRSDSVEIQLIVLANGCSDNTEQVVHDFGHRVPNVELVPIALGDKSNAWNVYIMERTIEAEVHFFIDGDTRACSNALKHLYQGLLDNPER